ncbi:hypothetical protein INT45_014316 [Circinella minor]|uniref:Uncharacterized protein n=1 Tax=Circinella minor TaxID=1195481 RepID=A0A8H7VAH6_9FUNG|nr:hypothetical protein INT45_014316 [Circinella minor]
MNNYMEPLVKELEELYKGVPISDDLSSPTIRAAFNLFVRVTDAIKAAKTPQERERIENEYGTRWSPLCRLKYFQQSRQVLLDPFHNLYLGTCKRMMEL